MPYTENKMEVMEYQVDNMGNAYFLIKYFPNTVRKIDEYIMQIIRIDEEQYTVSSIQPEDGGTKKKASFGYTDNQNGTMLVSIFHTYGEEQRKLGLLLMEMGEDGNFDKQRLIEIPASILELAIQQERDEKDYNYALFYKSSYVDKSGNLTIVGQFMSINYPGYWNMHSNIVLQINKNGELNWIKSLDMDREGVFTFNENNLQILGLSNSQNDKVDRSYLTSYNIDLLNGDVTKTTFFKPTEVNGTPIYQFSFDRIKCVDEGVYVMEVYKKKKEDLMIRLEIED